MKKILITGAAGFIGFHLSIQLLMLGYDVVGIDNLNNYYDVKLKDDRLIKLEEYDNFHFEKLDITNKQGVELLFKKHDFQYVINLAAQAGVRYSISNPHAYIDSNIVGFINLLESCRAFPVDHFIYASSSSVYGGNKFTPFSTNHSVDHPVSLYAATKKANELMAHTYSHLYNIPTTGLRFFTVYGPYGRPDMAYFTFTKDIVEGNSIKVFNYGELERDFTYIDDVIEGILRIMELPPVANSNWDESNNSISESFAPYRIFNVGNNDPVKLEHFISILESEIGIKAKKEYVEMQAGDVLKTYADISELELVAGYRPKTKIDIGLRKFVEWYKEYYEVI